MSDTQTIKDRLDIAQLIGEYIQLKKAGANWKANCPFHQEKTPSFMVHPEKQFWHCFGCNKGGDIFTFVQEMEGLDFPEALKLLADKAGVKLDNYHGEVNKSQKNRILEINSKTAYFFHHFLIEMASARKARDYLFNRGLTKEIIEDWQIGYIPDQWELLTQYLLKKGFSIDDILLSGLSIKKEGADIKNGRGFYDRFRGRIMFPIWDVHGNVIGFTGRILIEKENSGGKYVNTPQTLVYDKSRALYGLNKAKQEIKSKDLAVLVEGQMDVIACHQAGMKNVVAISGTALTVEQAKLLKRYSQNIAMAFDADSAGQNAAKRGIGVALEEGLNTKVIQIPQGAGKDADECIKKNKAVWFKAVEQAVGFMDWYFVLVLSNANLSDARQKQQIAEILLTEINHLPYAVEREHWLKILADKLNIDSSALREESLRLLSKEKIISNRDIKQKMPQTSAPIANNRQYFLLENLLALFFKFPKLFSSYFPSLKRDFFMNSPFLLLYESALSQYNINNKIDLNLMLQSLDKENLERADILSLKADKDYENFSEEGAFKEIGIILDGINREWTKNRRIELTNILRSAQAEGDKAAIENILKKIMELS